MKKMLSLVGAAMLLAPCSAVMAQQYFVRVGGAHISPHSTASDVAGPMLPPPPSGIGLEVIALDGQRKLALRAGLENIGNVNLAKKSASFGYAERARRLFVSARVDF